VRCRIWICALLLAGLFVWPLTAEDLEPHMAVAPQEIIGVALFPDGRTPVVGLPVRIWDVAAKRFIYRSRTDKHGVFRVPRLGKGLCSLVVGRVKIDLWVFAKEMEGTPQRHDIVVVVPRKMVVSVSPHLFDVIILPALIRPPDSPRVVSP